MIGTTLAHYRITGALGAGGMGEVWRATDTRLGRDVALKVLPSEFADDAGRLDRFEREARAVASLNHPHIVTIYSVEDADGIRFLTMELVEGKTLDGMIPEGGFDVQTFFDLATPLAEAISAAHDKSVIHRDLKPANVMVDGEGRVKVMDFGLAKLQDTEDASDSSELPTEALTGVGMIIGTVPYMSPEQIEAKVVDHRTDIFSLGVLLYEMAIGERPFSGASQPALMSSILRDEPSSVVEIRDDLPRHLARIIGRCLAKDRRDRYQTARDVFNELKALRRESTATGHSRPPVVPPSQCAQQARTSSSQIRRSDVPWIAVLPFGCPSGDTDIETFADGLEEDIASGLSRFSYLFVVARKSTRRYRGEAVDVRQVGEELGARYVMEGGIRKAGSTIRIGINLIDTTSGTHLWSETWDRDFDKAGIFDLQDEITGKTVATVADSYGILVHSIEAGFQAKDESEYAPWEWVIRLFGYRQRPTPAEHEKLRDSLERAVERDPSSAEAWACLSQIYLDEHGFGFNVRPDAPNRALSGAQRAVDLNRASQLGYQVLAQSQFFRHDLKAFRSAADRAMSLNPRDSNSIGILGLLIVLSGDFEHGADITRRAMELNPNHAGWYHFGPIWESFHNQDYEKALEHAKQVNMPGMFGQHLVVAAACGHLGRTAEAEAALNDLPTNDPDLASSIRQNLENWHFASGLLEPVIEGLEKAGLKLAPGDVDPVSVAARSGARTTVGIAVLPFADMSPEKDQDYFCEGMAEEIMNALVRIEGIRVASRTSAFRARQEGHGLAEIARLLSVSHILEGSVRTAGNRLRVTAQLTDVASGYQLWSERFDRELEDVFAVQDEIAAGVVEAVESRLAPGERTIPARPQARNLEAYRSFLLGQHLRYAKEDHGGAVRAFQEAVRLDPTHAPSWTGLAESLALSAHMSLIPSHEACAGAREALATALELQGESADGLHGEGFVAFIERRWKDLEVAVRRAIEIEPSHVPSLGLLGMCLSLHQRPDEAEPFFERARQTDPLASFPYMLTALGLLTARRPQEAHSYAEQALTFEKEDASALFCSSLANVALGQFEEGIAAAERGVAVSHRGADFLGLVGWALATAGRKDEARTLLEELRARPATAPPIVSEGWLLGALGEIDAAFEVLVRAENENQLWLYYTGLPGFDPLRADQRFDALVERLGLPPALTSGTLVSDAPEPAGLGRDDDHGSDLAVAPIECDRSDPELCSLAAGLEEELTSSFAQFAYLNVRETDAVAFAGGGSEASGVGEVWRAAGIRYLVTGRLQRVGGTLRLSVRLLDTVSGRRLWSRSYDSSLSDFNIFELQDHLADRVVATVADSGGVLVRSIADGLRSKAPQDYNPTDWVMQTFAYWNQMREEEHAKLREGLESSVERDPHHSAIWACLAQTYLDEYRVGFNPRNGSLDRALEAALKAVELDPRDSLAQESLADVHFFRRDLTAFGLTADRALAINPRDATTMASMGTWLALSGELQRGFDLTIRAMEINPEHGGWYQIAIFFYYFDRDEFEKALAASKSMNMPDFFWSHLMTAAAAGKLGLETEARAAVYRLEALFEKPARESRREAEKFIVPEELLASFLDGLERAGLRWDPVSPVERSSERAPEAPGIAVLPFADHSAGDDQEWIAAGTHEALLTALQQIGGLRVTSRTSSMQYQRTKLALPEIARQLGVGWLVEGSVTRVGERMRITAKLVDGSADQQIWAGQYETDIRDILAQQNEVAREIAREVQVVITPEEDLRLARAQRVDPAAYRAYVRGLHHFDRVNPTDFRRSTELFEESTSLDPKFAPAHAALAAAYGIGVEFGWVAKAEAAPLAEHALRAVQRIDPGSASAYRALANVQFHIRRNLAAAEKSYRKAAELESNVYTLFEFGWLLSQCGRHEEAVAVLEEVVALDPRSPLFRCDLGWWCFGARNYDRAVEEALFALELDPSFAEAHWLLAISYAEQERYEEALTELELYEVPSGYSVLWYRGYILALAGRRDEAREALEKLEESGAPDTERAYIFLGLDDRAGVLEALEQAEGSDIAFQPYLWPRYATYHDDPRFRVVLEKFGLPLPSHGGSS